MAVVRGNPVENAPRVADVTNKPSVKERIRRIERRHKKEFTEVLADMHDHIFGNEDPVDDEGDGEPQTTGSPKGSTDARQG